MQMREFERKAQKLAKGTIHYISYSRRRAGQGFVYSQVYMHSYNFPTKCISADDFNQALALLGKLEFFDAKRAD